MMAWQVASQLITMCAAATGAVRSVGLATMLFCPSALSGAAIVGAAIPLPFPSLGEDAAPDAAPGSTIAASLHVPDTSIRLA
jgi:hypothetical protein